MLLAFGIRGKIELAFRAGTIVTQYVDGTNAKLYANKCIFGVPHTPMERPIFLFTVQLALNSRSALDSMECGLKLDRYSSNSLAVTSVACGARLISL